jgi:Flp pilus assembly protein TadG
MMKPRLAYAAGLRRLADFTRDRGGNVAMIFGITLLPFTFLIGAAIDYSGASELRARIQRATDATGLQLCQMPNNLTQAQYLDAARDKILPSYLGTQTFTIKEFALTENPHRIRLVTGAVYNTAVIRIMGTSYNTIPVDAEAQCQNQQETFEIALVLDTTGSMARSSGSQSKIDALKVAATNFVDFVYKTPKLMQSKISIIPFAAGVKVDPFAYRNATWIDQNGNASYHWNIINDGVAAVRAVGVRSRLDAFTKLRGVVPSWDWAGCFESLPYPLNVQDGMPSPSIPDSYYVPMFAPDESGNGGQISHQDASGNWVAAENSYIDDSDPPQPVGSPPGICDPTTDETQRTARGCKYLQPKNPRTSNGSLATGPNFSCTSRALTRLTADKALLLNEITQLQPDGNTDIHQGATWGWQTLAPSGRSVFGDGVAYDKPFNHKIMILMTDGMNTWSSFPSNPTSKSYYSAYGFYRNPDGTGPNNRLPAANANVSNDTTARAAMDALTLETCRNLQAAGTGKPNVVIYTIGFSVPTDPIDQQGINMLKTCAGDPQRAFVANDAQGIVDVFRQIGNSIAGLKLTQ